jgi:hypothetical protein
VAECAVGGRAGGYAAASPGSSQSLADTDVQPPELAVHGELAPDHRQLDHPAQVRAVGAHATVFAGEQAIDELAHAAKIDPVAFRIQNVVQGNNWAKSQNQDSCSRC